MQQHPRYSTAEIAALYDGDYYVFAETAQQRWARAVQQYVVHLLPWEPGKGKRLLDVGCGLGHLTALAHGRGWRAVGIDVSAEAVSRAAAAFHVQVRAGTLSRHRETLPPFDVIILGDVIEHVADPAGFISELRDLLAPGGVLCIDTPNWGGRWRRLAGRYWLGLNRYHINLFDADALDRLLEAGGYCDVRTGSYTHYRYESWVHRPEVQRVIGKLPSPLAWRINRFLDRRSSRKQWASLREEPPETLEEALEWIRYAVRSLAKAGRWGYSADNLVACARFG